MNWSEWISCVKLSCYYSTHSADELMASTQKLYNNAMMTPSF